MRTDLYTKIVLTVIALALLFVACNSAVRPSGVAAESAVAYGYLVPQMGNTEHGGKEFIDLRNGNDWECTYTGCKLGGKFALEKATQ